MPARPLRAALLPRALLAALAIAGVLSLAAGPARAAAEVQRVVSPGGIEAWLVESHAVPVIAMDFAFEGGTALDPEGKEGLANLASATLDEGAGDLDSQAFRQRLADNGIRLRFSAGTDTFSGSLQTVTEKAEEAFSLTALALTAPRFDEAAVARMKAAIGAEIRRNVADPDWLSRRALYERVFAGHPYGRPSRGTLPTLASLTPEDLRGFVARRLAKDNLVVGVAGDITPEELGSVLDRVFGGLPDTAAPVDIPEIEAPSAAGETILVERAGAQSTLFIAQPGLRRDDPDWYAATVLNSILGAGVFTSRLGTELREERGLTYGIYSRLAAWDHADLWLVSGSLSNANVAEALATIREVWSGVAEDGVTRAELDDAKTYLTGSFPLNFTSTDSLSGALVAMQRDGLGIDYLDRRNGYVEDVTLDDVNALAARLLDAKAMTTVVAGDPPEGAVAADETLPVDALAARELGEGS
ncbi:MAG: pitrilysin family protein [Azospirillaceae bacterium]